MSPKSISSSASTVWLVFITGLGFMIDTFDGFSYNVMRVASLTSLGLSGDALTSAGISILNHQVIGALIGGFVWGLLGDRIGRKKALFGSILCYSIGMIANACVTSVEPYALCRFLIGFGIAGEVGLGATLVGENLSKSKRTFGLAFFSVMGLCGVAVAAISIEFFSWRYLYAGGGIAGLLLLGLRAWVLESHLFLKQHLQTSFIKPLRQLLSTRRNILRYAACVLILAPNFFVTGVLLTLSPEVATALHVTAPLKANIIMAGYFIVAMFGDLIGAALTSHLHSRKRAITFFMTGNLVMVALFLYGFSSPTLSHLYVCGALMGLFNLWALSATVTVEQFPTTLRATVSTTVVNLARSTIVVFNLGFLALKPAFGTIYALGLIGGVILVTGIIVSALMRETYHTDLEAVLD